MNWISVKMVRSPGSSAGAIFVEEFVGTVGYHRAVARWQGSLLGTLISGSNGTGTVDLHVSFNDHGNDIHYFVTGAETHHASIEIACRRPGRIPRRPGSVADQRR